MNILFVYRDKHSIKQNFKSVFKKNLCNLDFGFFLLSLKSFSNVTIVSLPEMLSLKDLTRYDHIIIDTKISLDYYEDKYLPALQNKIKCPTSLFIGYDRMLNYKDVKNFEKYLKIKLYFVPNLLADLSLYKLSDDLEKKLFSTYYGMGFLNINYNIKNQNFSHTNYKKEKKYGLSYCGKIIDTKKQRKNVIDFLEKQEFDFNKKIIFFDNMNQNQKKLSTDDYVKLIEESNINLVLSGNHDNIPYRLYEVLFFKSFFLIDKNFLKYKVSRNFMKVENFVFDSNYDLVEKIKFYLSNNNELENTRTQINKSFIKFYDPLKHGKMISKAFLN